MLGGRAEEGQDKGGAAVGGCVAEVRESGSGSVVREWETLEMVMVVECVKSNWVKLKVGYNGAGVSCGFVEEREIIVDGSN